jgi:hypothetical protein
MPVKCQVQQQLEIGETEVMQGAENAFLEARVEEQEEAWVWDLTNP